MRVFLYLCVLGTLLAHEMHLTCVQALQIQHHSLPPNPEAN